MLCSIKTGKWRILWGSLFPPFSGIFCVSPSLSQGPSSSGAAPLLFPLSAGSTRGRQTAKHGANRKLHWTLIYGKSSSKCLSQCCRIPWWLTVLRVYKLLHSPFLLKTKPCWLEWWPPAPHFVSSAERERKKWLNNMLVSCMLFWISRGLPHCLPGYRAAWWDLVCKHPAKTKKKKNTFKTYAQLQCDFQGQNEKYTVIKSIQGMKVKWWQGIWRSLFRILLQLQTKIFIAMLVKKVVTIVSRIMCVPFSVNREVNMILRKT